MLFKSLEPLVKTIAPTIQQLHAERLAGSDTASVNTALLNGSLEETLNRLQDIAASDGWWRGILRQLKADYVRPDALEKPSIRAWLTEEGVRQDLKELARARLLSAEVDGAAQARLSASYEAHTLEARTLAAGPIGIVLNILLAGLFAPATRGDLFVVGLIQESHAQTTEQLNRIAKRFDSRPDNDLVVEACTKTAVAALSRILPRRDIPLVDARGEMDALAARLDGEGDLRFCAKLTKGEIYLWAARLHAPNRNQLDIARQYRAKAVLANAAADTRIVDAWLAANVGDVDRGLTLLCDVDSPDARSATFVMLGLHKGATRASEWLAAHEPVDPGFFTPLGWKNAATILAEAGRWDEAAAYLDALPPAMADECPDLPFVAGAIHAGLTLPESARRFVLTTQIFERQFDGLESKGAAEHRHRALCAFEEAKRTLTGIGEKVRANGAEAWRAWLLLNEPSSRHKGERIVAEAMRDGRAAVNYAQLAHTFNIPFDPGPLERHLRTRELAGGLGPPEIAAKLALWQQTRPKAEVVAFLENERAALGSVVTPAGYSFLLVTALAEADQLERAEETLRANREEFGDDFQRLADQIRLRRGEDVSKSLEDRFLETNADVDLQVLCEALPSGKDVERFHRYSLELYRRQRNSRNARRVCQALARGERHREMVEFLDAADDLVQIDDDIAAMKGWSLFYIGRFLDATAVSNRLRERRDDPSDRYLELSTVIGTCIWENFSSILNREWATRDKREPEYLLRLARLAADVDTDRALQLVREAAGKAATDPNLLASAAILAYRLGQDEQAMPWVADAARLSSSDGPVRTAGIRELMDIALAGADRTRGVAEDFAAARIPIHLAASFWRTPLVRLLVGKPCDNERNRDPRRHTVVPIRHGARGIIDLSTAQTVAVDVTSLLLLGELDLLRLLESRFNQLNIPWSTPEWLFAETHNCQFHQPSRVAAAKRLRELIVDGTLQVFKPVAEPPAGLVKEVGREFAELLDAAKKADGRVVRPLPVHRLQSLMEEEADLEEYAAVVVSTVQFLDILRAEAAVDRQAADQAQRILAAAERHEPLSPGEAGPGPIFLDDLAIAYLTGAGLVESLRRSRRDFRVHFKTQAELEELIHTEDATARALNVLSRIRLWLRDGIAALRVQILPRARPSGENVGLETRLVQELVTDLGSADALLMDDRMAGSLPRATDRSGRTVPLVDTFDLLHEFTRAGLLSVEQRWHIHHILRSRGFVCVPLEIEEFENYLVSGEADAATGLLRESAELRAIRENLQRLRSTTILQQPAETSYLDRLRITGFLSMRKLWGDVNIPIATAVARVDWIWRNLMSSPLDWAHTIVNAEGVVPPVTGLLNEVSTLLMIPIRDPERGRAFRDWLDDVVLAPLELMSPNILDDLARTIRARIRALINEWTTGPQPS